MFYYPMYGVKNSLKKNIFLVLQSFKIAATFDNANLKHIIENDRRLTFFI